MTASEYIRAINEKLATGNATEHTHRSALQQLIEALEPGLCATNEPKRIECGAPDFQVLRGAAPLGHVETKDIGSNLDETERRKGPHGDQFARYVQYLPNWILTDYADFRWFVDGEKRLGVRLADLTAKGTLKLRPGAEAELSSLLDAFVHQQAPTVVTAKELARRMAASTRMLRDLILASLRREDEAAARVEAGIVHDAMPGNTSAEGWLHNWLGAFRETLIPGLDEHQFADMFAQTLAYGLFAARAHAPGKPFSRDFAARALPRTNPFLRQLFEQIAGYQMPETIAWAVDDMVELLKRADMGEVLRDFGQCKGREDPVVHFYETFLAAYDPALRDVRGVFYTPEPVVGYIVRSIDTLLKTRLGRPKGLADENTLVLDTATGTATFLYYVIEQIHRSFHKQRGAWDGYVGKHLLPRLFGFELLMAPYAIAHLKLSMLLESTGYTFASEQRLGVYLTNTLEEAAQKSDMLLGQFISREANAAAEIKRDRPIMVVLGNPPYSGHSANKGDWIVELVRDYHEVDGLPLGERNPKWLQDDYVKFIRFAEWRIAQTGEGVLGYITNHGYLDNPTFRGMRQHLMQTFDELYVLDLHGNSKKKESTPDGGKDENVFDIQQGVAILLAVKQKKDVVPKNARVYHAELWGRRQHSEGENLTAGKYHWLSRNDVAATPWTELSPSSPFYLFMPQDTNMRVEYEASVSITAAMPVCSVGIVTGQDSSTVGFTKDEADALAMAHEIGHGSVHRLLYRPYDTRHIVYDSKVVTRMRRSIMRNLLAGPNVALIATRQTRDEWHVFSTSTLMGHKAMAAFDINAAFPLYLYPDANELDLASGRRPNLAPAFLKALAERLGLPQEGPHGLPQGVAPEAVFHYAYAVFHSPAYRTRYAEFLKIDFPRLPLTCNRALFDGLVALGSELVALHLMESPRLHDLLTEFPEKGSDTVDRVLYTEAGGRVWINAEQYFGGVPPEVWSFRIGGYQVCDKWLKDRKGRRLAFADVEHYQKVVVALDETIRLMSAIDALVEAHGGWPLG